MKLHLKLICFAAFLLASQVSLIAQSARLTGKVKTEEGPLPFATVVLRAPADSSIVKAAYSGQNGGFSLVGMDPGTYRLEISFTGMAMFSLDQLVIGTGETVLDPIELKAGGELETVNITATKPLIEVLPDKTVFNVSQSVTGTGNNGLELLRKAPGVIVDNNENIILDGKPGVQIYIDGKPSVLAGEDLTNFLKSMQADEIETIELISEPSSKYDAAGTAGIINIRLKKNKQFGTNGTLSAGFSYGRNGLYNSSLSLNNRTKKTNLFGTYSNNFGRSWNFIYLDRTQQGVRYDSETETLNDKQNHNLKVGMDFFPVDRHTIGILVYGNVQDREEDQNTITPIIPLSTGELDQTLTANNQETNNNLNLNGNLNYRYADTTGHEFGMDLDYGIYERERIEFQPNTYVDAQTGAILLERDFRMITPTEITVMAAKADYSQNLWKGKLGFGAKISQVSTDNRFDFFDVQNGEDVLDTERSNRFEYTEQINAAYVNYNRSLGMKWKAQVGLRVEQTISEGNLTSTQQSGDANVKRNYTNLFPSGGLTYNPSRVSSWALRFSRRIQRPNYQSLNPFVYQSDELTIYQGNPFLQPQYTNSVKLSHTYRYFLTTAISYSYTEDFFAQVTDTLGATRNFMMTRNIANMQTWSLNISCPFEINKWWSGYASINAYRASYSGTDEAFQAIDQNTLSLYAQTTFRLPADFKLEISGWFSSPSVWGGTYLTKSLGSLDAGIQKKFFRDRLTARMGVSDIFFTSPWRADMRFGDLYIDGTGGWEARRFKLNLNYAFGSQEVKSARKRNTALEEENKRVGN